MCEISQIIEIVNNNNKNLQGLERKLCFSSALTETTATQDNDVCFFVSTFCNFNKLLY